MSYRGRIHWTKIKIFKNWLISEGWKLLSSTNQFEEIRAKKGFKTIVYYKRIKSDQLSSSDGLPAKIAESFLSEAKQALPKNLWENCSCGNVGGYPTHCCGGDEERCKSKCPEIQQCEFCWTNPASVFNQERIWKKFDDKNENI